MKQWKRILLIGVLLVPAAIAVRAASVSPFTGPVDAASIVGALNTLIGQVNGTVCNASGATPQTCNGTRGAVVTNTLVTAAATNAAYVINNNVVNAGSVIQCNLMGYSGTIVTNGYPIPMTCVPGAGTITVNITNTHAANALNGTVTISFTVEQN